jgi:hypothetical protein
VEAGSNTSTVTLPVVGKVKSQNSTAALRVVGGDEKGTPCLGNLATLFLGDINTGTWPSKLGESRI